MNSYFDALCAAMSLLAGHGAVFMGQAVAYPGTAMSATFRGVPRENLLEMPVAEDMQMGMATGMALGGLLPVCCYPRWNFLLLATNQLVLHLDKLPIYSNGGYRPKVIIRTAVATDRPLDPGAQHVGDFTEAYRLMLKTVQVRRLDRAEDVLPEYEAALERDGSSLLVERTEFYS